LQRANPIVRVRQRDIKGTHIEYPGSSEPNNSLRFSDSAR
jgi:hypothetical protein